MIRNTTSHFDAAREQLDELLWLAEQFLYTLDKDQPECYPDDERLSLRILADFLMVNHLFLFDPKSLRPDLKELLQHVDVSDDPGCILAYLAEKSKDFRSVLQRLSDAQQLRLSPKLEGYFVSIEKIQYIVYELFGSKTPALYVEKGWADEEEVW